MVARNHVNSRLRRMEGELLPPPPPRLRVLRWTDDAEGPAARQAMLDTAVAAVRDGERVWIVAPESVCKDPPVVGPKFEPEMWRVRLDMLLYLPSKVGLPNAAHDLFAEIRRNATVIGPDPLAALPGGSWRSRMHKAPAAGVADVDEEDEEDGEDGEDEHPDDGDDDVEAPPRRRWTR